MQRRRLGRSSLEVGWLGLAPAGQLSHADELRSAAQALVASGGNLLHCAADQLELPALASVVQDRGLRNQLCLDISSRMLTRGTLLRQLDDVLHELDLEHVDLWTLTGWSDEWSELATAATVALASGRAHYVALGFPSAWQNTLVAAAIAQGPPGAPVSGVAHAYSLVDRSAEAEVIPAALASGGGLLAGAPLGHGVLTGKYRHGTPPDSRGASERHGPSVRRMLEGPRRHVIDGVVAAAEGLGTAPANVALAWLREAPGVTGVVASARTIHQWRGLLGSDDVTLPHEIRSALNDVSAT